MTTQTIRNSQLAHVTSETLVGSLLNALCGTVASAREYCTLTLSGTSTDTETFTLGSQKFEIFVVNTDLAVNANAVGTTTTTTLTLKAAPATAVKKGELLKIESEMLLVTQVNSTTSFLVARGYAGTTAATHADDSDVFRVSTARTGGYIPSSSVIPVPYATAALAAATAKSVIMNAINYFATNADHGQLNDLAATLGASDTVVISRPFGTDGLVDLGLDVFGSEFATTSNPESFDVTADIHSRLKVGDYVKAQSEVVEVASIDAFRRLTVNRAKLGTSAASHADGVPLYRMDYYNSEALANGTLDQFHNGNDVAGVKRVVVARALATEDETIAPVMHVRGTVKGWDYRIYDSSNGWAKISDATVAVVAGTNGAPDEVTLTEGATPWGAGDYLVMEIFYV